MYRYKFTQPGTFSMAVLVPVFGLLLFLIFSSGLDDIVQIAVFIFTLLVLSVSIMLFYKITIFIDDKHVSFSLGCGLFSKKYSLDEIKSCKPVRNPVLYGIGIRKIPGGWLYNVSGQNAIEVAFKNRRSVIRIGTNKPEEVAAIINRLIKNDVHVPFRAEKEYSGYILAAIIFVFSVLIPASLILAGNRETEAIVKNNKLTINGMYGININCSDIISVDTLLTLPGIKRRDNGYAAGNTLKGKFTFRDGTKARLFVRKNKPPFINIKTQNQNIWLNFTYPDDTRILYNELKNLFHPNIHEVK